MTKQEHNEGLQYRQHDNGIHEFIFVGETDTAGDEFFNILKGILTEAPVDSTLRYIVDVTQNTGRGSMTGLVRRFRKLQVEIPERAAGRTAILHNGNVMLTLASTFISTLAPGKDQTRFFKADQRDAAIIWLLKS